ncbi:hypothetical protein FACS18948_5240 [Clostridia bacterium]|nr:hypothetical protein FACS18948_5240 [Clostridia bacterium]
MRNLTQTQIDNIILDAGILFANYGETGVREIGITKGGVEFNVTENVRQIEYDGRRGMTKGMEVVDSIDAYMKVTTLEASQANIMETLAAATNATSVITNSQAGVVPAAHYLKNVTVFGKQIGTTKYKKITLFNAGGAGGITVAMTDKAEAGIAIQFNAHWNPLNVADPLYKIEDSTTAPTTTGGAS